MKSHQHACLNQDSVEQFEASIPLLRQARRQIESVQENLRNLNGLEIAEEALRWCMSDLETAIADIEEKIDAWNEERRPIPYHDRDRIVLASTSGDYPWDVWERRAIAEGVSKELAALGRSLMREAYQHSWDESKCKEAGWDDRGRSMIEFALQSPESASERWRYLLVTF